MVDGVNNAGGNKEWKKIDNTLNNSEYKSILDQKCPRKFRDKERERNF